jgi:hypothetical protein
MFHVLTYDGQRSSDMRVCGSEAVQYSLWMKPKSFLQTHDLPRALLPIGPFAGE